MARLIIAKDLETGKFAAISDAWLTRYPGEFEKIRNIEEPVTAAEKTAAKKTAGGAAPAGKQTPPDEDEAPSRNSFR
jgi:hypothetical protein